MPQAGDTIRALDFPAHAFTSVAADETAFTDTAYVAGASVCGVTFVAPSSGAVQISWHARCESNTINLSVMVSTQLREGGTIGSGTIVHSPADTRALEGPADDPAGTKARIQASMYTVAAGLTAGSTYNVRTMHRITGAGDGDIFDRSILVTPLT